MNRFFLPPFTTVRAAACAFLLLTLALTAAQPPEVAQEEGSMIMQHWLKSKSVDSEMAFIRMQTLGASGAVETKKFLMVYHRRPDKQSHFMVRLMEPEDIKGVTVLAKKTASGEISQYSYLPAVGRLRPLSGDGQAAPFLGSDFSYEDFLEEIPEEQIYTRRPDKFVHGAECFVVRAKPKQTGASAYAYRDLYIDRKTFDMHRIDFFGAGGEFLKYFAAYDYDSPRIAGQSTRPRRAVMTHVRGNSSTILTVVQSRINAGNIDEAIFSAENIQNWSDKDLDSFIYDMFLEVSSGALDLE